MKGQMEVKTEEGEERWPTREVGVEEVSDGGCFGSMSGWKACLTTEATCKTEREGRGREESGRATVMGVLLCL